MITIEKFKNYLGFTRKAKPAVPARGTLTLNRKTGVTGIIRVPDNLTFSTSGKFYKSSTESNFRELNQSQSFIPYLVVAVHGGPSYNLTETNQIFAIDQVVNFTATNESPIVGGLDAIPEMPGINVLDLEQQGWTDDRLQEALDVGTYIVRELAGNSDTDLTDNILIREAIYLMSMYRLQNNQTTEKTTSFGDDGLSNATKTFFRDRSFLPLMQQVQSLISQSGKRNLDQYFGDIK